MADNDPNDRLIANGALAESGATADFPCKGDGIEFMEYLFESSLRKP